MSSTEMRKKIDERIQNLEQRMEEKYGIAFEVLGKKCFKVQDDEFFMLTRLGWANAIVIEHAETEDEARKCSKMETSFTWMRWMRMQCLKPWFMK